MVYAARSVADVGGLQRVCMYVSGWIMNWPTQYVRRRLLESDRDL